MHSKMISPVVLGSTEDAITIAAYPAYLYKLVEVRECACCLHARIEEWAQECLGPVVVTSINPDGYHISAFRVQFASSGDLLLFKIRWLSE